MGFAEKIHRARDPVRGVTEILLMEEQDSRL
jgi:hypothetical protein